MGSGLLDCHRDVLQGSEGVLSDGNESDAAAVGHHCIHTCDVGEAVVQREDDQHYVILADVDDARALGYVCGIVAVCKKDTLRVCGSTGSVADIRIVIRSYGLITVHEGLLVLGEELFAHLDNLGHPDFRLLKAFYEESGVVEDDHFLDVRTLGESLTDSVQMVCGNENPLALRVLDTEDDVRRAAKVD